MTGGWLARDLCEGGSSLLIGRGRVRFFPELFPVPKVGGDLGWQRVAELVREHADLPAMVGFVGEHVAKHLRSGGPGFGPGVAEKLRDGARAGDEGFGEHLGAARGALGQGGSGLLKCRMGAVQLWRRPQVRRGKPDPLGPYVVHVGKDGGDGADTGGWFRWRLGFPDGGVEVFDEDLVHAFVGGEDAERGWGEL
jgi:hypothetical protein